MNPQNIAEIYKFKTKSGTEYIFDNVTGTVVTSSEALQYVICNFSKEDKQQLIHTLKSKYNLSENTAAIYYDNIKNLVNLGCFYRKGPKFCAESLDCKKIMKTDSSLLTLIVTENCNLRCRYCIYSNYYPHIKGYSNKVMDFTVAKKAIDIYMELHEKRLDAGFLKKPAISFYGGEPLLEFKLLKEIIAYCKEKKYTPVYYITTNGTIMNKDVVDFLLENEIVVTFSLDGSREQHDRNRIFENGQKSFDLVFRNICKLQEEKRKRKIKRALLFSCCYDSYTNMVDVVEFFNKNNDLFDPYFIVFSQVYKYNTSYYHDCNDLDKNIANSHSQDIEYSTHIASLEQLRTTFIHNTINGINNSSAITDLFSKLNLIHSRYKGICSNLCGACTIGSKIAVDPSGLFYICEKMSQTCSMGNVNTGIDFDLANRLQTKFLSIINSKCAECSVSRLCSLCYMHVARNNDLEFNEGFCKDSKVGIHNLLASVFSVLESNPKALGNLTLPAILNDTDFSTKLK